MEIDANKFDRIARGGGYLGAALARTTELFIHFFDHRPAGCARQPGRQPRVYLFLGGFAPGFPGNSPGTGP